MIYETEHEKDVFFRTLKDALVDALKEIEMWKEKRMEEREEQLLLEVEEYEREMENEI